MIWKAKQHHFLLLAVVVFFISILSIFYSDRLISLHHTWLEYESHYLNYSLLVIAAYFSAHNFSLALKSHVIEPKWYLIPVFAASSTLFLFSDALDLNAVFFAALAIAFPLLFATMLGYQTSSCLLNPWGIAMMGMPFWTVLTPILQSLTVVTVSAAASMASLTVLIEGNYFTFATGIVHVEGGCAGLKYFVAALTIAFISCSLDQRRIKYSVVSLIVAAALSLLGNWIRVFILMLVAYYEGVDHPLMSDHDTLGWVVFAITMLPWLFLDRHLDSLDRKTKHKAQDLQAAKLKPSLMFSSVALILFIIITIAISPPQLDSTAEEQVILPTAIALTDHTQAEIKPSDAAGWSSGFPVPRASLTANVNLNSEQWDLLAYSYPVNGQHEMANSTHFIFDHTLWQPVSDETWQSPEDASLKIRIALAKSGSRHRIAYYWFKHDNTMANTILMSKLEQLIGSYNSIQSGQLVALSKECNYRCQHSLAPSNDFQLLIKQIHSNIQISSSE